ncbi:hypothetical protein [Xanthobacter sp. KR7-225]|uniref:hypothetical protein n=1 Tax=Xanthobacter sp. KR7-225 TaxID=3156613 RepID=UPI0032B3FE17
MGRFRQPEDADLVARLVADVLDAAACARHLLSAPCDAIGPGKDGARAPDAAARAALARFIEETALAAVLLRAAREGDLDPEAARRETERLGPCPDLAGPWPTPLLAQAERLAGLRRALAAQAAADAAADSADLAGAHAGRPDQRMKPRRRPCGRPRLRLVESEGL